MVFMRRAISGCSTGAMGSSGLADMAGCTVVSLNTLEAKHYWVHGCTKLLEGLPSTVQQVLGCFNAALLFDEDLLNLKVGC